MATSKVPNTIIMMIISAMPMAETIFFMRSRDHLDQINIDRLQGFQWRRGF